MKASKRPTPLHINTLKDKIKSQLNSINNKTTHRIHHKHISHHSKISQNNHRDSPLLATFGQSNNQCEVIKNVDNSSNKQQLHPYKNEQKNQNNQLHKQKKFTIQMIQIQDKQPKYQQNTHKLHNTNYSAQKFSPNDKQQQFLSHNKNTKNNIKTLSSNKITPQLSIHYTPQNIPKSSQHLNKQNITHSLFHNLIKNSLNPQNQQNLPTQYNSPSPSHSYSNLPIHSNTKHCHIPILQKYRSIDLQPNFQQTMKYIPFPNQSHNNNNQLLKSQHPIDKTQQIIKTAQSTTNNNLIKTTQQQNESQCISLIHQDNNTNQQQQNNYKQQLLTLSNNTSLTNSNQDNFDFQKSANDLLKLVANLGSKKSDSQMEKLRNKMKSQKNLKLKDYLRLTSLSNDVRFDKYNKSQPKIKQKPIIPKSPATPIDDNQIIDKTKTAINPQRSISLIKASLHKKLSDAISTSLQLFQFIQQGSELVGDQYEDLVFVCNFHRVFNQNMFKTADLLQDIFNQYQAKQQITKIIQKKQQITQEQVIQLLSPRKKKKKQDQNISMLLVQKILMGLNVIKMDDVDNNYSNHPSSNTSQLY